VTDIRVEAYFRHEHGADPVILRNADDADRLVDALLAEPFENSVATLYAMSRPLLPSGVPDHEMLIAVNAEDGVGGLRYMGDGTWYAEGAASRHEEVYYLYMGHDRDFPRDSEISIDLVRLAVKEFLATNGERPTVVGWRSATD
jgi:hypothetical protein